MNDIELITQLVFCEVPDEIIVGIILLVALAAIVLSNSTLAPLYIVRCVR